MRCLSHEASSRKARLSTTACRFDALCELQSPCTTVRAHGGSQDRRCRRRQDRLTTGTAAPHFLFLCRKFRRVQARRSPLGQAPTATARLPVPCCRILKFSFSAPLFCTKIVCRIFALKNARQVIEKKSACFILRPDTHTYNRLCPIGLEPRG